MIEVKKITPFVCEAFDPEGKSLGFLNLFEFNDLRIQIRANKAEGYYMQFEGQQITIDANGECSDYPKGFYDQLSDQLFQLI